MDQSNYTNNIVSWMWDFGDGEISNDTNPSHTYNEYGAFTITLTATGPVNNDITNQSINVFLPSPIITDISDVPDDQGGRVYLTFVRSGHDTDSLNRFESYQVERLDDIGWVGVTNYNAYGTDIYNIEVPTMLDSTAESNAITSFRVISSMDEGLWESNIYDGYSVDNLAPSIPENIFVSSVNNDMYLGWDYIMNDDFSHHQVNQILGEPYSTVTNDITIEIDEGYNEFFLNSVDVHENISEQSEEHVSAYNLHQGANLVSFSILPENNSIDNVLNGIDVNAIIGEGVASTYNPDLGWLGSLLIIQPNEGYWLKSSNGEILNIIGAKYETSNYNLHYGANLISYNCAYPALITDIVPNEFISSIIGEGLAATYNPALGWVGSLYSLNPGQGYWVFSENSNADWSYDCSSLPIENLLHRSIVTTLNDYIQSTEQAFYFFKDIEGVDIGNVIRAYHGDAMIGSREWNGPYTDIPVMGKDFQQETRDYATLNSTIRFTIEKDGNGEINLDGEFPLWSNNGIFIIEGANIAPELPENYSINKIYPNPFNPSTTISYSLPEVSWVNISIYDIKGVKVDQLIDKNMDAGYHSIVWDSKNQASGVYIVQVSANGFRDNKKVMLMK